MDIISRPVNGDKQNLDESQFNDVPESPMFNSTRQASSMLLESSRIFTMSDNVDQFHGVDSALGVSVI